MPHTKLSENAFFGVLFLAGTATTCTMTMPSDAVGAALPMAASPVAMTICGNPVSCTCTETVPCGCHQSGSCSATIVATADNFDYDNSACHVLTTMQSICAIGQTCAPPASSSCGSDDGCEAYGSPNYVFSTKYFALPQGCECDPV